MTYYEFVRVNNITKQQMDKSYYMHIDSDIKVYSKDCFVSINKIKRKVKVKELVNFVINGRICVSNPSALANWNFEVGLYGINLWHGSEKGIIGSIKVSHSENLCDFGKGFYLGDVREQAENRVCNYPRAVLYRFNLILKDFNVYTFSDDVLWALFIAYNRGKIDFRGYPKLIELFNIINNYDIIVGNIADDKIADAYNEFLNGRSTTKVLTESLKLVKYGKQYVIKNQKCCSKKHLQKVNEVHLTKEDRARALQWGRNLKVDMNDSLEKIRQLYRREGKFLDEVLKEYM